MTNCCHNLLLVSDARTIFTGISAILCGILAITMEMSLFAINFYAEPVLSVRHPLSPFGVGCIFGFTAVLGGASTLIVDRSYLTRNIRFHFWNCVGLFGTGVLMILFCNFPLVECHLRSDIQCYDDINQWSNAFRYGYLSCFLGRGVCGLLIITLSVFGGAYAIKALDLCDCFPQRQQRNEDESEEQRYPNYRKFNNEPIQHVQLRDLRGML